MPNPIPYWNTEFGPLAINAVTSAISSRQISQGPLTERLESVLSDLLSVDHVMVPSGSMPSLWLYMPSVLVVVTMYLF